MLDTGGRVVPADSGCGSFSRRIRLTIVGIGTLEGVYMISRDDMKRIK